MSGNEKKEKVESKDAENNAPKEYPNVYMIDYTIKDLVLNKIIETSSEKDAKQDYNLVFYKGLRPVIEDIKNTFPKVIDAIKTMKEGDSKVLSLTPKDAYGNRQKEMLKVVPFSVFKENNLRPAIGLTINANGMYGTIRSVSGGRVLVDFNSPYADHDIEFSFKFVKVAKDSEKAKSVISEYLRGVEVKDVNYSNSELTITADKKIEENATSLESLIKSVVQRYMVVDKISLKFE